MKNAAKVFIPAALLALLTWTCGTPGGGEPAREGTIAGIGLTRLTVYDQRPAPDGLQSGTPHIHAVTDEGYYVVSGTGKVELHDVRYGFRTIDLSPGRYVQFPPLTLHRLVNTDHLVVLVVMGNAGLAEQGDARIYYGEQIDASPTEYDRLTGLVKAEGLEGALKRRDEAIKAYAPFLELWKFDKVAYYRELERFAGLALQKAGEMKADWAKAVEDGPGAWVNRYRFRVKYLPFNRDEMFPGFSFPAEEPVLGMCGLIQPVGKLETVK